MRRKFKNIDFTSNITDVESGYRALARAICAQAVLDYASGPKSERTYAKRFIQSETFTLYSGGLDGHEVLAILDRRIRDGR